MKIPCKQYNINYNVITSKRHPKGLDYLTRYSVNSVRLTDGIYIIYYEMKKAFIQVINNCAIARDSEGKSVIAKFIDSDVEGYVFDEFCDNIERLGYELDFTLLNNK